MSNAKQAPSQSRKSSFLSKVGAALRDAWALFELQSELQMKAAMSYGRGPVPIPVRVRADAPRDRRI